MPKARSGENALPAVGELDAQALFNMKNKVCVVTGGGSGIGAMISTGLVDNGSKVYIASRKDISGFAAELTSRERGECIALKVDLIDDDSVLKFVEQISKLEPAGIDVLVNNSGTNWSENLDTYSMKGWDKVYALNTRAVFYLTQQLLPALTKKGTTDWPARVVNISSIAGEAVNVSGTFAYNSGKAATTHLSRHLAGHLAGRNITVNAICPGFFPSRMTKGTISTNEKYLLGNIPLQRFGDIKDIVPLVLYLCGRGGNWVTGQKFIVDGGELLKLPVASIGKL